jgi:hypothetical protein
MSLKIERDTFQEGVVGAASDAIHNATSGHLPGTSGKHPIAEAVGTALTGGRQNAGTKGYLAVRHTHLIATRSLDPTTAMRVKTS